MTLRPTRSWPKTTGRPGLTQNTQLSFLSDGLLAQAFIDSAGDTGVTVLAVPSFEPVNRLSWDATKEAFAGFVLNTAEVAILSDPPGGDCCQRLRLIDPRTKDEHVVTLPPLTFAKAPVAFTRNFVFDQVAITWLHKRSRPQVRLELQYSMQKLWNLPLS